MQNRTSAVGLMGLVLSLTGCMGNSLDLDVRGGSVSGDKVHLVSNGSDSVDLTASTVGKVRSVSLYDSGGNAMMSFEMDGVIGATLFSLGFSSKELDSKRATGIHADSSITGQLASVDVQELASTPVHNEYDSTESCSVDESVTECKGEGSQQVCKTQTITRYGHQEVHVVRDGTIYNFDVKISQGAAVADLQAGYDKISSSSYPLTGCIIAR